MNNLEIETIEKWQSDPSFINWVYGRNKEDLDQWDKYFEAKPQHIEIAEVAKFSILNINPKSISEENGGQKALSNLLEKIDLNKKFDLPKRRILRYFKMWQVAASLLIILTAGIWSYTLFDQVISQIVLQTEEESKNFVLSDGTKVILNGNSTLKYFENEERKVTLTGEAYFEVKKQPTTNSSFQVLTNDLVVTVLGTEFNVNSNDEQTRVYLDEGKVKLSLGEMSGDEIEMKPGELVSYSKKQDKVLENRKALSLEETAWKEEILMFDEASLSKVIKTISLIYKVDIESNFPIEKNQLFTGGLPADDLDITLQTLKEIFQFDIKKVNEKYIID